MKTDKKLERNASVIAAGLLADGDLTWIKNNMEQITHVSVDLARSIKAEVWHREDQDMCEATDKAAPSVSGRRVAASEDDGALISFRLKKERGLQPKPNNLDANFKEKNMELLIMTELQCQALLAVRFAQGKVDREHYTDAPDDLTYELLRGDPIPKGLRVGDVINGTMDPMEDCESRERLPMYTSYQG